jgi:hypothetical protein
MAKQHRAGKLTVIRHADIAGSSLLAPQEEDLTHERIQNRH